MSTPRGWYPNPEGEGLRHWNGWRWGEVRPEISAEVRHQRLEEAVRSWARSGYKIQYCAEFDAQLVRGIAGHRKVFLSVNEVGELIRR
jgi:hypothetical protein